MTATTVTQASTAASPETTNPNGIPFEPVGPQTYVPKVKNLLTGLAATDDEVQAVVADPTALRGLIDKWMDLPEFQPRMLDFLRNAFQQNQVTLDQLQADPRHELPRQQHVHLAADSAT